MAKKSNKTSHVLNLITNRTGLPAEKLEQNILREKTPVEKTIETQPEIRKDPIGERHTVKIARSVSEQIRVNLEKTEREEFARLSEKLQKRITPAMPPKPSREPRVETFAPLSFNEAGARVEDEQENDSEEEPEDKQMDTKKERATVDETMTGLVFANILEEVMRMEAPKVMKGFDMCECDRCINDVLALALNRMPPKYVVSQKGALFAKIASYGNQYKTDIYTSLTHACVIVKDSPSHSS